MTIDRWISDADPAQTALEFEGEVLTYGAFAERISARSAELRDAGLKRGDRVAWYGLNHPDVFVLLFACARIGAMLLPLNWRLSDGEIAQIVADAEPKLILHDDHFAKQARSLQANVCYHRAPVPGLTRDLPAHAEHKAPGQARGASITDPVLLVYTSGSTGLPKGVVLTQKALVSNAKMSVHAHGLTSQDRVLNALPLFHVGGLNILPTPAFSVGATVVLQERFDPVAMANALPSVHHAITVPTVLQAIMATPDWTEADLAKLRALSIGSTDVPIDMIETVHARGVPVIQIYGATETSPFAIYQTIDDAMETVGSIGRAGNDCQIRLVADGQDVPDGTPGEIWVKGDNILTEYWRNPDLTAEMIVDGWFRTGDVAIRDGDGQYFFADRIKHVVISGGENIYPAEIERVLRKLPGVAEVAVVGRPDPKWGEIPVAVVVGDASLEDVLGALHGQLARYKYPKDVVFADSLPRNAMGKVVAAEVRKLV